MMGRDCRWEMGDIDMVDIDMVNLEMLSCETDIMT